MKRTAALLAIGVALFLTGCTATPASAPSSGTGDATAARSSTSGPSAAPLVAETPSAPGGEGTAGFLDKVRDRLAKLDSQIPNASDEQLISAGQEACDRLRAGESTDLMSVIDGEQRSGANHDGYYYDSNAIIMAAQLKLCRDTLKQP